MGLRESIGEHRAWAGVAGALLIIAVGVFALREVRSPDGASAAAAAQAYYSTDDGAHFFPASADLVPPCDIEGKTAVRAIVFTPDDGKTKFVGYLERYTPQAKKEIETNRAALKAGNRNVGPPTAAMNGIEVKKPGASNPWVPRSNPQKAGAIMSPTAPGGGALELVMP